MKNLKLNAKQIKKSGIASLGHYIFLVGVLLAVAVALYPFPQGTKAVMAIVLIVAGLVVGLINITSEETVPFLVAAIALIVSSGFAGAFLGSVPQVGQSLQAVFVHILIFVSPAALVVALKTIYSLAKRK